MILIMPMYTYSVDGILCSVSKQTVSEVNNTGSCVNGEETLYWEFSDQCVDNEAFKISISSSHTEHRSGKIN